MNASKYANATARQTLALLRSSCSCSRALFIITFASDCLARKYSTTNCAFAGQYGCCCCCRQGPPVCRHQSLRLTSSCLCDVADPISFATRSDGVFPALRAPETRETETNRNERNIYTHKVEKLQILTGSVFFGDNANGERNRNVRGIHAKRYNTQYAADCCAHFGWPTVSLFHSDAVMLAQQNVGNMSMISK